MLLPASISLRPITPADSELLFSVYASTRTEELAGLEWDAAQKAAFLRQQFSAQHGHYQQHYTQTSFEIILVEHEPAGRLYLARWAEEFRIVDIALLPPYRGKAVGTAILQAVIAEATTAGVAVSIHVEQFNPALRLYQRLGFEFVAENGMYYLMRRTPTESQCP